MNRRKNPAAVALGRAGGKKGGPARAAKLTPEQRRASARRAVLARWARAKGSAGYRVAADESSGVEKISAPRELMNDARPRGETPHSEDHAVLSLLARIKSTSDPKELRSLADELERAIFRRQFESA